MLKILIIMCLFITLNASEFDVKYLKCTLYKENKAPISLRRAKTLNEFNLDVMIQETELNFDSRYSTFSYWGKTKSGFDLYTTFTYSSSVFLNNEMILTYAEKNRDTGRIKLYKFYQCKDASLYEKMKMKVKYF